MGIDGDSKADLLFRHADGSLWTREMNGTARIAQGGPGSTGAAWHVLQVADYSGDGRADILTGHDSGELWGITVDGTAAAGGRDLGNLESTAWHLA